MMKVRKLAGRRLAIVLVLGSVFVSGCNKASDADAKKGYDDGIRLEQQNNSQGAFVAYQTASRGTITESVQALANLARVGVALKKYDDADAAYKALATSHSTVKVNTAPPGQPEDNRLVSDWIGTPTDQNPNGPWYNEERLHDEASRGKIAYRVMDTLVALTGRHPEYSYALAILIFTVVIKLLMTPLTIQQFQSTRKMQLIQPKMKLLQDKYKEKPEELNKAMLALYKDEGVNPLGCGMGMLLQFPILIALYQVIKLYNFQFRSGHFLWVNPATHGLAPLIVGRNLAQPDMILLVLYAISMFVSQRITMMPTADEQTRQQQQMMSIMMPVMFLFVLKTYPSAFILYWLMFNFLTTWQTWNLMKKHPALSNAAVVATAPPSNGTTRPVREPDAPVKTGPSRTPAKRKRK